MRRSRVLPIPVVGAAPASPYLADLVGYWPLHETTGNRNDVISTTHLAPFGSVTYATAGMNGNCADFEQSTYDYLSGETSALLAARAANSGSYTIAGWYNLEATRQNYGSMLYRAYFDGEQRFYEYVLLYLESYEAFALYVGAGNGASWESVFSLTHADTGTWHFLCAWYDALGAVIGIQINDDAPQYDVWSGTWDSGTDTRIGYSSSGYSWDGKFCEVGIWNRVLTDVQRAYLYNSGAGRFYPEF